MIVIFASVNTFGISDSPNSFFPQHLKMVELLAQMWVDYVPINVTPLFNSSGTSVSPLSLPPQHLKMVELLAHECFFPDAIMFAPF